MNIKAKIAAGAATLTMAVGSLGLASGMASAATPTCGSNCTDISGQKFGPGYLLDVYQGRAAANQEVILFQGSDSDPAEDFTDHDLGTVGSFYKHYKLVSAAFASQYSGSEAHQYEYAPEGVNSGLCAGTWPGETAVAGFKVRLEPCGHTNTLWADDKNSNDGPFAAGFHVLVAGETDSFSNPEVLNYPAGHPTDMPRPWLTVQQLANYAGGPEYDSQAWTAAPGAYNG